MSDVLRGYQARPQTARDQWPLVGVPSCEGCAFADDPLVSGRKICDERPCSRFEREDGQDVIFVEKA